MKVLLVKTSSMGDVIHTLPALTDAQHAIPDLCIDWVVEPAFAEIPQWHGAVRTVIPFPLRKWRKHLFTKSTWQEWRTFKQSIQTDRYDKVIDAQGLLKSALFVTRLAHGTTYGYDRHSAREGLSSLFYDQTFKIAYQQHAVERIRQLFARTLDYPLPQQVGDYGIAKKWADLPPCNPYLIAIHSTTRHDKHWDNTAWVTLFHQLADIEIHLPWGNEAERKRADYFATCCSNVKVLPKLTLTELARQIAGAKAVISVDTGLSHLTAALDKPNVILYGATDPKLIGAYGENQHYLHAQGMGAITAEHVFQALKKAM